MSNQDSNGLRWHRLSSITLGPMTTEVLAASCEDGIGFFVRWEWNERYGGYDRYVMDTESCQWQEIKPDSEDNEYIPLQPPTNWDDL